MGISYNFTKYEAVRFGKYFFIRDGNNFHKTRTVCISSNMVFLANQHTCILYLKGPNKIMDQILFALPRWNYHICLSI